MSKAEDLAEKAYPQEMDGYCENNAAMRVGFKIGYHQAEKDMELSWEDVEKIIKIHTDIYLDFFINDNDCKVDTKEYYQEVLKQFKERKDGSKR